VKWLWAFYGREDIEIDGVYLILHKRLLSMSRSSTYMLSRLSDLHYEVPPEKSTSMFGKKWGDKLRQSMAQIIFNCDGKKKRFAKGVRAEEARGVIEAILAAYAIPGSSLPEVDQKETEESC